MKSVLREELLTHLMLTSGLMDQYAKAEPGFVDAVVDWLKSAEQLLQRRRNSLGSMPATERGRILSVRDGGLDKEHVDPKLPKRKALRVVAASAMGRVELEIRQHLMGIENELKPFSDKIAQLLALSSKRAPIPLPSGPRELWLGEVWRGLAGGETQEMFTFVNASLPLVDRLYLLDSVVSQLLEGAGPTPENTDQLAPT